VTGQIFRNAPLEIEDHAADVRALYDYLIESKKRDWKLQPLMGGRIPHGQQHSTLVSIAGTLRRRRICDEAIEACLKRSTKSNASGRGNQSISHELSRVHDVGEQRHERRTSLAQMLAASARRRANRGTVAIGETDYSRIKRESKPVCKTHSWPLECARNGKVFCTLTRALCR